MCRTRLLYFFPCSNEQKHEQRNSLVAFFEFSMHPLRKSDNENSNSKTSDKIKPHSACVFDLIRCDSDINETNEYE